MNMCQVGSEQDESSSSRHLMNLNGIRKKKIRKTLVNVDVQNLSVQVDEKKSFFYVQVNKLN
jgi:hypothetical protein